MNKMGPVVILLVILVMGAFLGYAWGISDVAITDTGLWQLHPSYQGMYVQAVADAYAFDGNDDLAADRLQYLCQDGGLTKAVEEAQARYGTDPVKRANLDQLNTLIRSGYVVQNTEVQVCSLKPSLSGVMALARYAWAGILLIGIAIVVYGVLLVIRSSEEEGFPAPSAVGAPGAPVAVPERAKPTLFGKKPAVETAPRSAAAAGAQISATVEKTDFSSRGMDPPIVQFMTTYLHGDDLYDDSFSIETPSGEFLGETGVGISETIGAGSDVKKVTAFEVWLFDKNDVRTVTNVLMSEHAFNDDALRSKLQTKGEAILAQPGDKLILETATLRVQARVVDLAYGSGPLPPDSFFERITIELAAWKRQGQPASPVGPPSGATGLPSFGA
ncbi:MAG: hypothetical protein JXB30_16565 [Anaerolineae bacterium]|nr:hypothetical protein [Anaerolineae bacterium]